MYYTRFDSQRVEIPLHPNDYTNITQEEDISLNLILIIVSIARGGEGIKTYSCRNIRSIFYRVEVKECTLTLYLASYQAILKYHKINGPAKWN